MSLPTVQRASFLVAKQGKFVVQERPVPSPSANQLLVRVRSAGVNPLDWKIQSTGIFVENYPVILGLDAAGVVEQVGSAVSNFSKGDRVFFQGNFLVSDEATFQEYAVVASDVVGKIPDNVTDDAAASVPVTAVAGLVGLFNDAGYPFPGAGPTASNVPLVILGGSSSVGLYTTQLARIAGFSPIITTAAPKHKELLESLGATHVIDRDASPSVIRAIAPKVSLVFDAISTKETQEFALDIINPSTLNAKLLTVVTAGEDIIKKASADRQNPVEVKQVYGFAHAFRNVSVPFWQTIGEWLKSGKFVTHRVEVVGGLDDIQKALDQSKAGVSAVKLIINP